jgi:glutaryl-CoA dehydrogenase
MFNYLDALCLNDQLTEEERTLRDQARAYCTEKLMPRVVQAFRDESGLFHIIFCILTIFFLEFDPTLIPELGKMGFLGAPYQVSGKS